MPKLIPLEPVLDDAWYPGFKPEYLDAPWLAERARPLEKSDESRFWFIDFHWPSGFSPMGCVYLEDAYAWGSQWAARKTPLPPGNGMTARMVGTHVYGSEAIAPSVFEIQERQKRLAESLPVFLENFPEIWKTRVAELESGLHYFETYQAEGKSLDDLGQYLADAREFHRRAWEIHFEIMYPLLVNYLGFYGLCGELGIGPGQCAQFLQGYDTRMMECDRTLWRLAEAARDTEVARLVLEGPLDDVLQALRDSKHATNWMKDFDAMLKRYGLRTEGIADPMLAPWIEDPTPALGVIRTFLLKGDGFDFDASHQAAVAEREKAIETARARLSTAERASFDQALATCQHANFPWWNEDHNYYIDLRATVPIRMACLAIGRALGLADPTDTLFCFHPELLRVCRGELPWREVERWIEPRRAYYRYWLDRRSSMPKVLGTVPDTVADPVLIEIFGIHRHFLDAIRGDQAASELTGVPASGGRARGPARVLHDASELHTIRPGDVLVCEGTTPSWTPAFTKIAACVCDGGGTLTHASIISREYRVPCVVGVGVGTVSIRDGDEVEVDGDTGRVSFSARAEVVA